MTDNEIIKALECCQYAFEMDKTCDFHCPMRGVNFCQTRLIISALSLINRQKADIERFAKHCYELDVKREEIQSTVATVMLRNMELALETAKAEAIKEFAERLRKRVSGVGVHNAIDCVEMEMVGGKDD